MKSNKCEITAIGDSSGRCVFLMKQNAGDDSSCNNSADIDEGDDDNGNGDNYVEDDLHVEYIFLLNCIKLVIACSINNNILFYLYCIKRVNPAITVES